MVSLSICFTVYNQVEYLKKQLDEIIENYLDNDIEIVISDDCSTDNIYGLIQSYDDKRIKYYRVQENIGHDLNILYGIERCIADYIIVLRTRDNVCSINIKKVIDIIKNNPSVGYFYFSALDEKGKSRLVFKDKIYKKGEESRKAHFYLPEHPSGNVYNRRYLNIDEYRTYIEKCFDNKYGFCVHEMIRCDLSTKADFLTSSEYGWIYANTLKSKDVAVNSTKDNTNVYSPEYGYTRYQCLLRYAKETIKTSARMAYLQGIIHEQYILIIGRSGVIMSDARYIAHYNSKYSKINRAEVGSKMDEITDKLIYDLEKKEQEKIWNMIRKVKLYLFIFFPIKEFFRNMLINTPIAAIYRKIIANKKR